MRTPTKTEEENEALAKSKGFYLWHSGGGIMGYSKDVAEIHVFIGCAASPECFEDTTALMENWGFDIEDEGGYRDDLKPDRKDTDLETALSDADAAIENALDQTRNPESIKANIEKLDHFNGLLGELEDLSWKITECWEDKEFTEVIAGVDISMFLPCSADEWPYQIQEARININEEIQNQKKEPTK